MKRNTFLLTILSAVILLSAGIAEAAEYAITVSNGACTSSTTLPTGATLAVSGNTCVLTIAGGFTSVDTLTFNGTDGTSTYGLSVNLSQDTELTSIKSNPGSITINTGNALLKINESIQVRTSGDLSIPAGSSIEIVNNSANDTPLLYNQTGNISIQNANVQMESSSGISAHMVRTDTGKVIINNSDVRMIRSNLTDNFITAVGGIVYQSVIVVNPNDIESGTKRHMLIGTIPASPTLDKQTAIVGNGTGYNADGYYTFYMGYTMTGPYYESAEYPKSLTIPNRAGYYSITLTFAPSTGQAYDAQGTAITQFTLSGDRYFYLKYRDPEPSDPGITFYPIFGDNCGYGGGCRPIPSTGFSTKIETPLSIQPANIEYKDLSLSLEMPTINVSADLVEVPLMDDNWSIDWLQDRAGLLSGSSLPGEGTAFIAAHNHLSVSEAGPFREISGLKSGDLVFIRKASGELMQYAVYANELLEPNDLVTMTEIAVQEENGLVLITCENESVDGGYLNRRVVYAKPISKF